MKEYRKVVADAFALQTILMYIADRADDLKGDAADYRERATIDAEQCDSYYSREAAECEAKAAAFERLLEKLAK